MCLKLFLILLLVQIVFTFTDSDYYLKGDILRDHSANITSDKVPLKYDNESNSQRLEDFVSATMNVTDPSPEIIHTPRFKHQSKLSPFGDLVFGSLLVIFCKYSAFPSIIYQSQQLHFS